MTARANRPTRRRSLSSEGGCRIAWVAEHAEACLPTSVRLFGARQPGSHNSGETQDRGDDSDSRDEDAAEVDHVVVDSPAATAHAAPPLTITVVRLPAHEHDQPWVRVEQRRWEMALLS